MPRPRSVAGLQDETGMRTGQDSKVSIQTGSDSWATDNRRSHRQKIQ